MEFIIRSTNYGNYVNQQDKKQGGFKRTNENCSLRNVIIQRLVKVVDHVQHWDIWRQLWRDLTLARGAEDYCIYDLCCVGQVLKDVEYRSYSVMKRNVEIHEENKPLLSNLWIDCWEGGSKTVEIKLVSKHFVFWNYHSHNIISDVNLG